MATKNTKKKTSEHHSKKTPKMEKKPASSRRTESSMSKSPKTKARGAKSKPVLDRNDPELGVVAIIEALEGVHFPATKDELLEAVGDRTVRLQRGTSMKLGDLIEDLEVQKFESLGGVVGPVAGNLHQQVFGIREPVSSRYQRAIAGS